MPSEKVLDFPVDCLLLTEGSLRFLISLFDGMFAPASAIFRSAVSTFQDVLPRTVPCRPGSSDSIRLDAVPGFHRVCEQ